MIRVIVRSVDFREAANVGGPVHQTYKTFDITPAVDGEMLRNQLTELEGHLRETLSWAKREVVGVEVLP